MINASAFPITTSNPCGSAEMADAQPVSSIATLHRCESSFPQKSGKPRSETIAVADEERLQD